MPSFSERLAILISADAQGAIRELERVGGTAQRELGRAEKATRNYTATFTKLGVTLTTAAAAGAVGVYKLAGAASELEQATGAIETVFGDAAGTVDDFAQSAAQSAGLSEAAAKNLTAQFGALIKNLGFTAEQSADTSVAIAKLGADMSAASGGTPEEAVRALGAAMRGERDPIERFGVSVKQADVNAKAAALGLDTSTTAAKKHADAVATLALIYEQTADIQGQFGREFDTLAGQQARARAEFENTKAAIGEGVLPVLTQLTGAVGKAASSFNDLPDSVTQGTGTLLTFATGAAGSLGSLALLAAGVSKLRNQFTRLDPERNVRSFTRFGATAVTASAGIAILAAGLGSAAASAAKARAEARELAQAFLAGGEAAEKAANQIVRLFGTETEQAARTLRDQVLAGTLAAENYSRALTLAALGTGELSFGEIVLNQSVQATTDALQERLEALTGSTRQTVEASAAQQTFADLLARRTAGEDVSDRKLAEARGKVVETSREAALIQLAVSEAQREGADAAGDLGRVLGILVGEASETGQSLGFLQREARDAGLGVDFLADEAYAALTPLQKLAAIRIEGFRVEIENQGELLAVIDAIESVNAAYGDTAVAASGAGDAQLQAAESAQRVEQAHRRVDAATRSVTDAQRGLRDAQKDQTDAAKDVATAQAHLDRVLHGYAAGTKEATDAVEALEDAQFGARDAQLAYREALQDLAVAQAEGSGTDVERALLKREQAADRLGDTERALADQQRETNGVLHGFSQNSDEAREAQDELREAQERLEDATYSVRTAQQRLEDAHYDVQVAALAAERAEYDAAQATRDAGGAADDTRQDWIDLARGVNSTEQKMLDYASATADASGATQGTAEWTREYVKSLRDLEKLIKPGSPLYEWFQAVLADSAALLDQGGFTGFGILPTSDSGRGTAGIFGDLGHQGAIVFVPPTVPGRASGGPARQARPYVVGEEGPELFIPDVGGRIVPNDIARHAIESTAAPAPPASLETATAATAPATVPTAAGPTTIHTSAAAPPIRLAPTLQTGIDYDQLARILARELDKPGSRIIQNNYWNGQQPGGDLARANYRLTRKLESLDG